MSGKSCDGNTMNIPIVSIIIPAFNAARTIVDTLESVRTQTFHAWEALIIDDGSTDETYQLASAYVVRHADTRIKIIRQPNSGAGAARNSGISQSQGEYIAFLDADDIVYPASIANRCQMLQKYPNVPLVFSDYDVENRDVLQKNILKQRELLSRFTGMKQCKGGEAHVLMAEDLSVFWQMTPFPICMDTVMVRRMILPMFRTDIVLAEDIEMWWRIVRGRAAGYIDESTACYRRQFSALTMNTERYYVDTIKVFSEIRALEGGIVKRHISAKIAESWFELGYYYYMSGQLNKARRCLIVSIRLNILSFRSFKVYVLSMMKAFFKFR